MRSIRYFSMPGRRWMLAIPILLACAGCIKRTARGDVSTYGFETWAVLGTAVGGVVAAPVGWFLRKRFARAGYALLIAGPVALIIAPAMWTDRVVVDSNHFERSSVMPGSNTQSIRFEDVAGLRYHSRVERSGRRSSRKYYLDVMRKTGQVQSIALGTLYQEAVGEILRRADAKGIVVSEDHE